MSQERLEAITGVKGSGYISQIETGARGRRPSRDKVLAIAQALQADPRPFLEAAGRLTPADELSPDERPSFLAVVETDPRLRSDQKRILADLYRAFVGGAG